MYAIIKTGGKQYKVAQGDVVSIEKLDVDAGSEVSFDVLVFADGADIQVGAPVLTSCAVKGKVVEHGKGEKIRVFKYKPKKDYRKTQGHRQPFTKVEIISIG